MDTPEDLWVPIDLEVCVDNLANEIALASDQTRVDSIVVEILQLVDSYGPDRLRAHAPSLLLEAGMLLLEVAIRRMKAGLNVLQV